MPGVTVYPRRNKAGTVYVGRYTLPSKQRVPMPTEPTWEEAFAKTPRPSREGRPPGVKKPRRKGAKADRAARFQLRAVFDVTRIMGIHPKDVRLWQTRMLAAGYEHSTILAKRSLLRPQPRRAQRLDRRAKPRRRSARAAEDPDRGQDRYITPEEFSPGTSLTEVTAMKGSLTIPLLRYVRTSFTAGDESDA